MKYCAECGNEIQEDERFCSNCGTPVSSESSKAESNEEHVEVTNEEKKGAKNDALALNEDSPKDESSMEELKQLEKESSGSSKDGCIGCLVLIVIIVLIFKGCGFFFSSDDEDLIKQITRDQVNIEATARKNKYKNIKGYFLNTKVEDVVVNDKNGKTIALFEEGNYDTGKVTHTRFVFLFEKRGEKWYLVDVHKK